MERAATEKSADACNTDHDQNDNDQYYASDYKEEVFVNFHGIELVCSNCHQYFPSGSLVHKYLEAACFPGHLRHPQVPTPFPTSFSIRISKATLDSIGLSLAFRG